MAIWPIALIDRLRFLFLSPLFLVRTFTKANFCLAPLPPYGPKLLRPYRIVTVKDIFLPRHPTWDENANDRQTLCSQSAGGLSEKVVFPCHNNQNTWCHFVWLLFTWNCKSLSYQLKGTLFKNLYRSQESNIKQSSFTKDSSIHQKYSYVLFFMQPHITLRIRCTKINVLWNFTSITMTLFSITLKLVSFFCLN